MSRPVTAPIPRVPADLTGMSLAALRELGFRMAAFIDESPAPLEERLTYMPDYRRLVSRINEMEVTQ